jgi:hydroxypyruvate isomerase
MSGIRDNIAQIGRFHTAGNPGRNELDVTQQHSCPPNMRAIAATAFDGYVGQELMPKGEPFAALEQAYRACDV